MNPYQQMAAGNYSIGIVKDGKLIATDKDVYVSPVTKDRVRYLFEADSFCPSCGHDRDGTSISSIECDDGTHECQMCGARWREA